MVSFNPEKDIPDLSGKVVLVTGGNSGIGAAMVKALAKHSPDTIYLCARNVSSAQTVVDVVHETSPKANIQILQLDLSSFASAKACADKFNAEASRLDLLFLNAGVAGTAATLTKEGYEHQFGVNHMGHAYFCQLLMPKLLETQSGKDSDVRIMLTSSVGAHRFVPKSGLDLAQMKTTAAAMAPMVRYGHSKLANLHFARALAQHYPSITTTSHHPGTVITEIWGKADGMKLLSRMVYPLVWLTGLTSEKGAETGLWTATVKKEELKNGAYYEPVGKLKEGSENATDTKQTEELWEWTNKELEGHGAPGWPKL